MTMGLRLSFVGTAALVVMAVQTEAQNCKDKTASCAANPNISSTAGTSGGLVVVQKALKREMKGEQIKTLQYLLVQAGFKTKVDGTFGRSTERAVIAFQKKRGLDANGRADPKTIEALTE